MAGGYTLWEEFRRKYAGDRQGLRVAVATAIYTAHHASAGQDAPSFAEREEVVRKSWLYRADRVLTMSK